MKYSPIVLISLFIGICVGCGDNELPEKKNRFFEPVQTINNETNNKTNNGTIADTSNQTVPTLAYNPDIDILWVIDNSGSMCQEQDILRANFAAFAEKMADTEKNFHIAVTTTHMASDYSPEPVARPGYIQSKPQPIPGFDTTCVRTVGPDGIPIEGEYGPIREALDAALKCTDVRQARLETLTDQDIECAAQGITGCEISDLCGGNGAKCQLADLFPDPRNFRSIPNVLRAQDYQKDGKLDVENLVADFSCMSFVGTRGHGIEKGLSAILEATKPGLTGGAVEDPKNASAANHGFLRKDSEFGVAFITDENDCSHDGSLEEFSSCGDAICEYANKSDDPNSPLLKLSDMKSELVKNLRASKGRTNFSEREIKVASILGEPRRFDGPSRDECPMGVETGVTPVCANSNGVAYSGDRYSRFMDEFGSSQTFPKSEDSTQGWICAGDFTPALETIGELFSQ